MNVKEKLSKVLSSGGHSPLENGSNKKEIYECLADSYAQTEGAIAVLSDMRLGKSSVYYGCFAQALGISSEEQCMEVESIWEENLFRLVHPDDMAEKYLQELQFYNFVLRQPMPLRRRYHLESELRMRDKHGRYIPVHHRMYYVYHEQSEVPWLALCLYSHLLAALPSKGLIVNASSGETVEIGGASAVPILSARERQVLRMIAKGMTSKEIAAALSISIHTVSRHRQDILSHLNAKNSLEACRTAQNANII